MTGETSSTRELAIGIIQRLEAAGHEALLAGGCVRDWLMGKSPKDHDVATSARPEEVQQIFGPRRTLAIGAAFGVIAVLSPDRSCQVEVASFRSDGVYSDGRRPDSIVFSDARNDALRRDFTINGLFQRPESDEIIDYVDGRRDIEEGVIRAIGDPHQRIHEDKLRMLRGVRFSARFGFEIDSATRAAIARHAPEIRMVSGERIGAEMRRMLEHASRATAAAELHELGLMAEILDDATALVANWANWKTRLKWLDQLGAEADFSVAAAVLLGPLLRETGIAPVTERWKLSAAESQAIDWLHEHWVTLMRASHLPWSTIQPLLVAPHARGAVQIARAAAGLNQLGVRFCEERLSWEANRLNPQPLIDGNQLLKLGIPAGPEIGRLLREIRRAQLDGEITESTDAWQLATALFGQASPNPRDLSADPSDGGAAPEAP